MTYDYSALKSPILFNKILSRLNEEFVFVPKQGIIAGQSVASAIYGIIGIADKAPFRDIDVFIKSDELPWHLRDEYEDRRERRGASVKRIQGGVDDKLHRCSYDGIFDPICKNGYHVIDCVFVGETLNYVLVDYQLANTTKLQAIVDGFDINCCEAGIDLDTKTVYWTPDFEGFLRTAEIKLTNYLTPAHSIVRAAKKAAELSFATFNKRYISHAQTVRKYIEDLELALEKEANHKGHFHGHLFSQGYLSRFEKQKGILGDHFHLTEKIIYVKKVKQNLTFYKLTPKAWDGKFLNLLRAFFAVTKSPNTVQAGVKKGYINLETDLFYVNEVVKVVDSHSWKKTEFFNLMELAVIASMRHEGAQFLFNILFSDKAKLLKAMSEQEKIRAAKLIGYHQLLGAIQHLYWTTDKIRLLIKNLAKIDKEKYRFIIGEIEHLFYIDTNEYPHHGSRIPAIYTLIGQKLEWLISDNFQETLDSIYQKKIDSMDPRVLPPLFDKLIRQTDCSVISISEIVSEIDLFYEGNHMQHCVGGYWDEIAIANTFIFSIKCKSNKTIRSTLQVKIDKNSGYLKIIQNRSYRNAPPNDELQSFCVATIKKWNDILFKQVDIALQATQLESEALKNGILDRKTIFGDRFDTSDYLVNAG